MQIHLIRASGTPLDRRLLRDYTLQARGWEHPALLKVLDLCLDDAGAWVLLLPDLGAPIPLPTLAAAMHDLAEPCSITLTLAEVFQHLHRCNGRAVFNFEWERSVLVSHSDEGWRLGILPPTPADFAAHLEKRPSPSEADDSYTLGAILYELLSGRPWTPDGKASMLADLCPDLPSLLSALVMDALRCSPPNRPSLREWTGCLAEFGGKRLPLPPVNKLSAEIFLQEERLTSLMDGNQKQCLLPGEGIRQKGDLSHLRGMLLEQKTVGGAQEEKSLPKNTPVMPPQQVSKPVMPPRQVSKPIMPQMTIMPLRSAGETPGAGAAPEEQPTALRAPAIPDASPVDCSVLAPPSVHSGESLMVQVFLHTPDAAETARALAVEFDPSAKRLGMRSLEVDLPLGAVVMVELNLPGVEVDEPVQRLTWKGRTTFVQFGVRFPPEIPVGTVLGKVTLHLEGVPVGALRFRLEVVAKEQAAAVAPRPLEGEARRFHEAFISYSSKDRPEVLKRVQMLERFGIHFFQDVLNLEPGTRWEQELYRHIDHCDVFLLFWSQAARDSVWVDKEVHYALERQTTSGTDSPQIVPVLIEGPPVPLPPEYLSHLHFNDRLLYFIAEPKPPI